MNEDGMEEMEGININVKASHLIITHLVELFN